MNKKRYLVIVGIVVAAVALTILFYTMLTNHRPAITSLAADPERGFPSGSCQIVCNATAPDGDKLSYGWSACGGEIAGEGANVTWTAPDSLGSYNITVIVMDSRGRAVTDHLTIDVRGDRPPAINDLVASADWTTPSGNLEVTCNATDPEGDALSYQWTASAGSVSGAGAIVTWAAPEETGVYYITVVVKDVFGLRDTRFVPLSVDRSAPPTIENLTVTAQEPKYLKRIGTKYIAGRTKKYDIACNVSDTSGGVSYNWSCESGVISQISEDGSTITWTAPDETLDSTSIIVIVSDDAGNRVARGICLHVAACTSCTFG
jgi:hypothetical protein